MLRSIQNVRDLGVVFDGKLRSIRWLQILPQELLEAPDSMTFKHSTDEWLTICFCCGYTYSDQWLSFRDNLSLWHSHHGDKSRDQQGLSD
ncbi:hypothetical protein Q1695_002571 [Nippostrongylus brasiliensis]|nr:hypothetical protein Q1695_002571 [Nippostrongylus brasiliensis]